MSEKVNPCDYSYRCKEYAEEGSKKCEMCEDSIPKRSLFKPKKVKWLAWA